MTRTELKRLIWLRSYFLKACQVAGVEIKEPSLVLLAKHQNDFFGECHTFQEIVKKLKKMDGKTFVIPRGAN